MNPRIDIENEINMISPVLAGARQLNVFTLPPGYFDQLADSLLDKCIFQSSPKTNFADVPEGYFNSLADNILQKIKKLETESAATELRKLSPMLYAIQGEQVYTVPRGYFDTVADETIKRITKKTKVVAMKPAALWKYAAAAFVTGAIAVSSLWIANKDTNLDTDNSATTTILAQGKSATNQVIIEAAKYTSETEIDNELSALPDEAILKYLEKTSTPADAEMLVSNIDQSELPSQEDYLLDEQALDKYLEQIYNPDVNN